MTAGVTGTLPIANGGTNATATPTLGGVIVGTGTAYSSTAAGTSGYFLQSNGSAAPTWAISGGGLGGTTVFTSSGTFTIPAGKTVVKVTVVGGGGNGATGTSASGAYYPGGGGGAGGVAIKYLTGLTPGNTLTVTRGAVSATSSVASGTQTITTITCTGGAAGTAGNYTGPLVGPGGAGGTATNGDINIAGQKGGEGLGIQDLNSGCTGYYAVNAQGASSMFGSGGLPVSNGSSANNATGYGSGGGGGNNAAAAGSGTAGIIIFEY